MNIEYIKILPLDIFLVYSLYYRKELMKIPKERIMFKEQIQSHET